MKNLQTTIMGVLALTGFIVTHLAHAQTTTRIEWEDHYLNSAHVSSPLSYDGVHLDDHFTACLSSAHVYSFSSEELWGNPCSNQAAHQLNGHWGVPGAGAEMVFAGTGITVRLLAYGGGITGTWRLETANGSVVSNGTCTNYNDTWTSRDLEVATPASLPYGLYKLHFNVDPNNDNTSFLIDYADVSGCALQRIEEISPLIVRQGGWVDNDVSAFFSGGTQTEAGTAAWSRTSGDKMTVWFIGSGVGFVSTRNDSCYGTGTGKADWSIDDGARTGSVDLSQPSYTGGWYDSRLCSILATDLDPNVPHKLEVSVASDNANRLVWIDAFDTSGGFIAAPTSVRQWNLY